MNTSDQSNCMLLTTSQSNHSTWWIAHVSHIKNQRQQSSLLAICLMKEVSNPQTSVHCTHSVCVPVCLWTQVMPVTFLWILRFCIQISISSISSSCKRSSHTSPQFCSSTSDSHCTRGSESTQGPRSFITLPVSSQYTQPGSSHRVVRQCSACQLSTCPGQGWSGRGLQWDT